MSTGRVATVTKKEKMELALKIAAGILVEEYDESELYDGLGALDGDDVADMVQCIGYALEAATVTEVGPSGDSIIRLVVR
jgi:hypothetical protein